MRGCLAVSGSIAADARTAYEVLLDFGDSSRKQSRELLARLLSGAEGPSGLHGVQGQHLAIAATAIGAVGSGTEPAGLGIGAREHARAP